MDRVILAELEEGELDNESAAEESKAGLDYESAERVRKKCPQTSEPAEALVGTACERSSSTATIIIPTRR